MLVGGLDGGGRVYRAGDGALLGLLEAGADWSDVSLPLSTDFGGEGGSRAGRAVNDTPFTLLSERFGKSDNVSVDMAVVLSTNLLQRSKKNKCYKIRWSDKDARIYQC
jgi:hypothetical protein